jgi:uncharacterized protein
MFKRVLILGGLFFVLAPILVLAYVNPGSPKGAVNDFAGMLLPNEVEGLELKLDNFNKQTGNTIVIATINNLGGDTVENFAVQLFKDWGIGERGKDNGVLLLVSKEDREMRIEVGYGLEGALTDAQSFWLIRDVLTPAFKNGDYAGGLNGAVDKIIGAISGTETVPSGSSADSGSGFNLDWFFLVFFVPIWLASILGRSKSWWAGGVIGGVAGAIIGIIYGFLYMGIIAIGGLAILGLVFDYFVSKSYGKYKSGGGVPPWWLGGGGHSGRSGFGSGGGGGFGGFGGGISGGGGSSGKW